MKSACFLGSIALFLSSLASASPRVVERLEASVNNQIILKSDIRKFRNTVGLRAQLDPLFGGTPLAQKGASATDEEIRDFLIDEKMITGLFPLTDTEVDQEINSIQANNHITKDQLRAAIRTQGYTFEDYFDLIRIGAAKRNLIDREIRTKVNITDDDVRAYEASHPASEKTSTPSSGASAAYGVKILVVEKKLLAQSVAKEIADGLKFEDAVKKYSADASKDSGGDLGELTSEQLSPLIRNQVKKMRVGEVSPVIGNDKAGYLLFTLYSMRAVESESSKRRMNEIRGSLASVEYQHQLTLWLERQRQASYIRRAGDASIAGLPVAP